MAMEFRLPNLTGSGDEKTDIAQLRRFLFQHIQQLNVVMGQLEMLAASGQQMQTEPEGTGKIVQKVLAQTSKEYLTKDWFGDYFRVGLLYSDAQGQHYGVEIGHMENIGGTAVFRAAARLTPGESYLCDGNGNKVLGAAGSTVQIGSCTIETADGKLTIE